MWVRIRNMDYQRIQTILSHCKHDTLVLTLPVEDIRALCGMATTLLTRRAKEANRSKASRKAKPKRVPIENDL